MFFCVSRKNSSFCVGFFWCRVENGTSPTKKRQYAANGDAELAARTSGKVFISKLDYLTSIAAQADKKPEKGPYFLLLLSWAIFSSSEETRRSKKINYLLRANKKSGFFTFAFSPFLAASGKANMSAKNVYKRFFKTPKPKWELPMT